MKRFFIFIGIVSLLVSCQKELKQITATKTTKDTTKTVTQAPTPADTAQTKDTVIYTSGELQFTINNITYKFTDSIIAKQYIQNGSERITIRVQKDPSTFQINIFGSTQIDTGTYLYSKAMFQEQRYDYIITERDFSLQVLSYQNGDLNATFHSSRVSNGIIKDLKVIPQ